MAMIELLELLIALYVAISLGFVGFGMMMGGKTWARRVANFLFIEPVTRIGSAARYRARQFLGFLWRAFVAYLAVPLASNLWCALRWLFTPRNRRPQRW